MNSSEWEALPARKKRGSVEKLTAQVQVAATSATINATEWEALPARSKKGDTTSKVNLYVTNDVPDPGAGRMKVQKLQQIMDNIEARRQVTHNISTLASKDGCAGQYYECKIISVSLCSSSERMPPLHNLFRPGSHRRCAVPRLGCHTERSLPEYGPLHDELHD